MTEEENLAMANKDYTPLSNTKFIRRDWDWREVDMRGTC